jgi:hypothetical protein
MAIALSGSLKETYTTNWKGGKNEFISKERHSCGSIIHHSDGSTNTERSFYKYIQTPDFLTGISANAAQITAGALLEFIMCFAIAGIAIGLYPVLKRRHESLALGYVGIRIVEGVLFMVLAVTSLGLLVTLSEEFVNAGSPAASYFQSLGALLVAAHDWAYLLAGLLVFSLGALALNYMLYKSKLVPRFISIWGLIGAVWLLAGALLILFRSIEETSFYWQPLCFCP